MTRNVGIVLEGERYGMTVKELCQLPYSEREIKSAMAQLLDSGDAVFYLGRWWSAANADAAMRLFREAA